MLNCIIRTKTSAFDLSVFSALRIIDKGGKKFLVGESNGSENILYRVESDELLNLIFGFVFTDEIFSSDAHAVYRKDNFFGSIDVSKICFDLDDADAAMFFDLSKVDQPPKQVDSPKVAEQKKVARKKTFVVASKFSPDTSTALLVKCKGKVCCDVQADKSGNLAFLFEEDNE